MSWLHAWVACGGGWRRYGEHFGHLLLVIDLRRAPRNCCADISMCSKFEEEGEALLLPWLAFKVTAVRELGGEEQREWQAVRAVHLECLGWRFEGKAAAVGALPPPPVGWMGGLLRRCAIS